MDVVPIVIEPAKDAVETLVILPLASTVITGIADVEPNVPVFALTLANVIGSTPPETLPVASPDVDKDKEIFTVSDKSVFVSATPFELVRFVFR